MKAVLALALMTLPALAEGKISGDAHVTEVLQAARVGDVIRTTCPSITARMFVVYGVMQELKSYAVAQGYQEEEVKAFLKDPAEKARIAALADAYLAKAGATPGEVETYCSAGRAEIAAGTLAGQLLRSWK